MTDLTNRWYQTVRRPSESEEERDNLCNSGDDLYDDDYDEKNFERIQWYRYSCLIYPDVHYTYIRWLLR